MKVTTLDELEDARKKLRRGELEGEVEVSVEVDLDRLALRRVGDLLPSLGHDVEVEGTCRVEGVLTREGVEDRELEERVRDLSDRVEELSDDLSDY